MEIIEETTALGVPFCHFRTEFKRNQYNLTFTKTEEENVYEVHLIPLVIHYEKGKIVYDKTKPFFTFGVYPSLAARIVKRELFEKFSFQTIFSVKYFSACGSRTITYNVKNKR